jgi:hypothetical protein
VVRKSVVSRLIRSQRNEGRRHGGRKAEATIAFCSARAGGDGLKWWDAFRPDTICGPWSAAEVTGEPEPRGAARRASSLEHGEHGEDRTLTVASTMAPLGSL